MKTTTLFLASLITFTANAANAASFSGQGTWETTLQGRDLDGNLSTFEAYYDTVLNITWLADANYGTGSIYDIADGYGNGRMTWDNANAWAANLNPYSSGVTNWRLPTVIDTGALGCDWAYAGTDCGYNPNTMTGEIAHMFYTTLGNWAPYSTLGVADQPGSGINNTGPFSNLQFYVYWTSTEYAPVTDKAWGFDTSDGVQHPDDKAYSLNAWAVHDGDIGASVVPIPATAWLFMSGLLGLIGMAKRNTYA